MLGAPSHPPGNPSTSPTTTMPTPPLRRKRSSANAALTSRPSQMSLRDRATSNGSLLGFGAASPTAGGAAISPSSAIDAPWSSSSVSSSSSPPPALPSVEAKMAALGLNNEAASSSAAEPRVNLGQRGAVAAAPSRYGTCLVPSLDNLLLLHVTTPPPPRPPPPSPPSSAAPPRAPPPRPRLVHALFAPNLAVDARGRCGEVADVAAWQRALASVRRARDVAEAEAALLARRSEAGGAAAGAGGGATPLDDSDVPVADGQGSSAPTGQNPSSRLRLGKVYDVAPRKDDDGDVATSGYRERSTSTFLLRPSALGGVGVGSTSSVEVEGQEGRDGGGSTLGPPPPSSQAPQAPPTSTPPPSSRQFPRLSVHGVGDADLVVDLTSDAWRSLPAPVRRLLELADAELSQWPSLGASGGGTTTMRPEEAEAQAHGDDDDDDDDDDQGGRQVRRRWEAAISVAGDGDDDGARADEARGDEGRVVAPWQTHTTTIPPTGRGEELVASIMALLDEVA